MRNQIIRALRRCYRHSVSWVTVVALLNLTPLRVMDIDEVAELELEEDQLIYPDTTLGGYVLVQF